MKGNNIFEQSLKLAEQFAKDTKDVPNLLNSMLDKVLPEIPNNEKVKLQQLVKESNKIIENAKKSGDIVKVKQSIDELTNKYGRNNNT